MQEAQRTYLTPEEYLAMERQSDTKSEYFDGEVYAMTGGSIAHNQIVTNTVIATWQQTEGANPVGFSPATCV